MKLSIIIPVYNEKDTILEVLNKVGNVDLGNVEKEVIIVDDFSTDGTRELLNRLEDKYKILYHKRNYGKGTAIRTGISKVTGDIIIIQDADLEYDPNDYKSLIQPIINNETSVVYGSRRLKENNKGHSGFSFYIGGIGMTLITNLLYGSNITDEPTCYKVFRAGILKNMNLKCKRFEFCPEVTAKILKKGIKIKEVPISYFPRSKKQGKKINWRDGFEGIWTLLKYRFVD
jgi:glycosyltransferase involved in cell wall biosynthesis